MKRALLVITVTVLMIIFLAAPSYASVSSNITQFGSSVTVPSGETVEGNVTVFGANATVNGVVEGNAEVFGGNLTVNGRVGGNTTNLGGTTRLGENAKIGGDVNNIGGRIERSPGAEIGGSQSTTPNIFNPFASLLASLLTLLASLVLAVIVVAVLPKQTAALADTVESKPLASAGVGILATILIPVVFLALVLLIIVGWILIPFVALALPFVYFYGYVGVSRWLGRRIIEATHIVQESPIAQVIIGVLILGIIGFIPILGWLVVVIAYLVGAGAVILSKFGTGRPWFRQRAQQAPPPTTGKAA